MEKRYITHTPCGEIEGVATRIPGVVAFKGIRYATAGRFEYPTEVTHWDGVYQATEYGACAYQPRAFVDELTVLKKVFYYHEFREGREYTYSEDCLFLNVFAPETTEEKLPVIVYIHGGGFVGGCAHERHFDVPNWPTKGVIGVTINYRLGPLGFATVEGLEDENGRIGNYGLYDQYTALLWIKHNIAAFGGDPDNVTIMGQSAGAMSVQQHCLSPLSRQVFHKAVMSSGGGVTPLMAAGRPEKRYPFWKTVMEEAGCKTAEEFRTCDVETLFRAWMKKKKGGMAGGCEPSIDGELVVGKGHEILKRGEQYKIPYLIGTTSHDIIPPILYDMSKKWCKAQKDAPAYLWFFERNLPGDDHGAWHSSDLWYWFGTLENCWRPFTEKDYALADEMTTRLSEFAKSGNPNADGFIEWHAGGKSALTLGDIDTTEKNPNAFKLWHTLFTNKAPGE